MIAGTITDEQKEALARVRAHAEVREHECTDEPEPSRGPNGRFRRGRGRRPGTFSLHGSTAKIREQLRAADWRGLTVRQLRAATGIGPKCVRFLFEMSDVETVRTSGRGSFRYRLKP